MLTLMRRSVAHNNSLVDLCRGQRAYLLRIMIVWTDFTEKDQLLTLCGEVNWQQGRMSNMVKMLFVRNLT